MGVKLYWIAKRDRKAGNQKVRRGTGYLSVELPIWSWMGLREVSRFRTSTATDLLFGAGSRWVPLRTHSKYNAKRAERRPVV